MRCSEQASCFDYIKTKTYGHQESSQHDQKGPLPLQPMQPI
jgi:hypothetical protein